ncbi:MAG TPA: hypothetical protein VJ596_11275 [Gemmatimonadaceae bacterium]|nr:hypothetical protein [Gemmatimonadaceae bacterium]
MSAPIGRSAPDETIFTVLAERARRTPDWRLALYAGLGIAATGGVLLAGSARWPFIAPFMALAAFGVWGITDRELTEATGGFAVRFARRRLLHVTRSVAAVIGTVATVASVVGAMILILGSFTH